MTMTTYFRLDQLPARAKIAQLEERPDGAWRIILYEKDDTLSTMLAVINIFEAVDPTRLGREAVPHLPELAWVAYRGGWYAEVHLTSNYDDTNGRYLYRALSQAHCTPPFADAPLAKEPHKPGTRLPSNTEALAILREPEKCSLAVRLECHQVRLRNKASLIATPGYAAAASLGEALADICQGVQLLLGDKAE
jgi:hypothetical protein